MADRYLVGRQPIFDTDLAVLGYELLYRGEAAGVSDDAKTSEVLVRAGLDSLLSSVVGDRLAFVNTPRSFLTGQLQIPLPPEKVVLETDERDPELVAGCARLVEQGFTVALDNFSFQPCDEPLLEVASIVKIDVQAFTPDELARQLEAARRFDVRVVAQRVETHAQLELCRELAFDLYQGYVLSRPELVGGQALPPSRLTLLRLMERVSDPDTSTDQLVEIVEGDAGLSQRLLRIAGAGAAGGMRRGMKSIREAVVLMGRQQLRSWLLLMLSSATGGVVPEVVSIALVRAKMSELLMAHLDADMADSAFTVGLVSGLELILGAPLPDIVPELNLADPLVKALLERAGPLGSIHNDVLAWEVGMTWLRSSLDSATIEQGYLEALRWVNGLTRVMAESA